MEERALFTDFWTNESKITRNVLARIPEGPEGVDRTADLWAQRG